ncbi:MAG: hypothetical protein ABI306_00310 [Caulobacteraceae bacterium]
MKIKTAAVIAALALVGGLAACETATPYQPLEKGTAASGGFTDQRLDGDHFRVTFQGNSLTSRETVETYLLYRAAELTVAQGFDWFETADRHTERDSRTYIDPDPFYGPGYAFGYWRPYWSYWGPGYGWGGFGPFGAGPFWGGGATVQTVRKFRAAAEIVMGHGPKPAADARAFDARAVIANLGPKIQRPPPPKA